MGTTTARVQYGYASHKGKENVLADALSRVEIL